MHNCKSPFEPLPDLDGLQSASSTRRRRAGFSLIEVSMALAIVAIAFVALIGLLPAGMKVFEAAANQTAQTRMVSHLTSLLQAADYTNVAGLAGVSYYYDVDGGFVDSSGSPVVGAENQRIFIAKVLVSKQNRVGGIGTDKDYDDTKTATQAIIVMARNEAVAMKDFDSVSSPTAVSVLKPGSRVKTQAIVLTRMDLEPTP